VLAKLKTFGLFGDAVSFVAPMVEPIFWLFSPSFRTHTRERWVQGGRRLQIDEVG
jgi:hypothetical protein